MWRRSVRVDSAKLTTELLNEVEFAANFTATTILHPATYLNKVLVGSQQGEVQLWNVRTA